MSIALLTNFTRLFNVISQIFNIKKLFVAFGTPVSFCIAVHSFMKLENIFSFEFPGYQHFLPALAAAMVSPQLLKQAGAEQKGADETTM